MDRQTSCSSEELLDHLRCAVEEVFHTMLNTVVTLVTPSGEGQGAPPLPGIGPHTVEVEALVEFTGPRNGAVVLRCSAEGAMDIARGLLMLDAGSSVPLADVRDAIGECANMVTGALKTRAFDPYGSFSLGVPRIGAHVAHPGKGRAGQLVFRMSEGCAAIEIWLEEPAGG